MNVKIPELAKSLSLLERKLLPYLQDGVTVVELANQANMQDVEVKRGLLWLGNRNLVTTDIVKKDVIVLSENGLIAKEFDLAELRILKLLVSGSKNISELVSKTLLQGEIMASIGVLKSLQVAIIEKTDAGMTLSITPAGNVLVQNNIYPLANFFSQKNFPLDVELLTGEEKQYIDQLIRRKDFIKKEIQTTNQFNKTY
jgi:hypothetical protein